MFYYDSSIVLNTMSINSYYILKWRVDTNYLLSMWIKIEKLLIAIALDNFENTNYSIELGLMKDIVEFAMSINMLCSWNEKY